MSDTTEDKLSPFKLIVIGVVGLAFAVSILRDLSTTDVRVEINTRYAELDYQSGELRSMVAQELTLYDVSVQSDTSGRTDVTFEKADAETGVTLSSVRFPDDRPVRLTVQSQGVDAYDLKWQPQRGAVAVIAPEESRVTTGRAEAVKQITDSLQMYGPVNDTTRLAVTGPTTRGDMLRTAGLLAASFTPPPSADDALVFSEIVNGTLVWSDLENEALDIPHGETVALEFSSTASLTMTLRPEVINLVIAGSATDVRFGAEEKSWSAMPSWFKFLGHQAWFKAITAFLGAIFIPVVIERMYAK